MKGNISIRIKAYLLLIVFSINTVIGFACAMGVDMGFNAHHHENEEEATEVSVLDHEGGKMHEHHDEATNHHHKRKDDCCNEKVLKIFQTDKSVPQSNMLANHVFVTAFISSFCITDALYYHSEIPGIKYFFRGHHPPIPNIRIAIQSFQI